MAISTNQSASRNLGYQKRPDTTGSRIYRYLPIAILLVSNFIPLLGVLYWGWDTFVLLMLYWLETLIIAFWTLLRILIAGDFSSNFFGEVLTRLFMFAFFLVHAGGFMLGHFVFLWAFFGKGWLQQIPVSNNFSSLPVEAFWEKMVVANGLLIPLAVSFIGRGIAFIFEMSKLPLWKRLVSEDSGQNAKAGGLVGGLYGRIITMHVVIIIGAMLAQKLGALAPLLLLIVVKTAVDLWFFVRIDLKDREPASA
ncbi:MAG TPA: DUF6498-containing protein [Xanthobacteraceae bacterium]|nr:DUF6498-containing protein [Xanthobacteraceae bacterium]